MKFLPLGDWINRFLGRETVQNEPLETNVPFVDDLPPVETDEDTIVAEPQCFLPNIDDSYAEYASSEEYLWDHLRRIDCLIRAYVLRWLHTIGKDKPSSTWGMLQVSDGEINRYLDLDFIPPDLNHLQTDLYNRLHPYWKQAEQLEELIQNRVSHTDEAVVLRILELQQKLNLTSLERDVLLIGLLGELDERYRRLFAYLQDDATRARPSIDLIMNILQPIQPDMGFLRSLFDSSAALQTFHIIEIAADERKDLPPHLRSVEVDRRIVAYVMGQDGVDDRLSKYVCRTEKRVIWEELFCETEQVENLKRLSDWLSTRQKAVTGVTFFLHGTYGSGRLKAAQAICTAMEQTLLVVQTDLLLHSGENWERMVDLVYREARLYKRPVYWTGCENLLRAEQPAHLWDYLVTVAESYLGITFFASQTFWEPSDHFTEEIFIRLDFPIPGFEIRKQIWLSQLAGSEGFSQPVPDQDYLAHLLANNFQLTERQIKNARVSAQNLANRRDPANPLLTVNDLYTGCRLQSNQQLVSMARRVEPHSTLTFENLILPPANMKKLDELRSRVRNRNYVYTHLGFEQRLSLGTGLIALFAGSSGTGKTMAAELLAKDQGVDLYKIDLSAVVSKWVGETEKNMSTIFKQAQSSNAILFFDEADALFGKRGEVKEAQDRWANLEVNYLLQRIEEYTGVVIMASNLGQNIDDAFMRRIHMIIDFPFPDAEARLKIWKGMFPAKVQPPPDNELRALAERFKLAGGNLKNVVVDAAFRALNALPEDETLECISQRHLVVSVAREYQKQGKPITLGDFGNPFFGWIQEDIL